MRTKANHSELSRARESATKAGIGVGKLYCGKKGNLQVCPDWRLLAWGSCRWSNSKQDDICDAYFFSLVGPKVEVETKLREVVSY